jgi:hypothetical protein
MSIVQKKIFKYSGAAVNMNFYDSKYTVTISASN